MSKLLDIIPLLWKEFLRFHTSPATPAYAEAEQWLREGWTWERVVAEWPVGADILWAAEWMGLIDSDAAQKLACTCVDRCASLTPDVYLLTDAVRKGDMTAAAFGAACIMGNAEAREENLDAAIKQLDEQLKVLDEAEKIKGPLVNIKEPIMPESESMEIAGASKARYAATLLVTDPAWRAMSHAVQAKVHEARGAWAEALREAAISEGIEPDKDDNIWVNDKKLSPVTKAVLKEMEAAIPRVKETEEKEQAYIVRAFLGGLK